MTYVALDGPDGCGKSTQAAALVQWLGAAGRRAVHVREPGSTPVGEALAQRRRWLCVPKRALSSIKVGNGRSCRHPGWPFRQTITKKNGDR